MKKKIIEDISKAMQTASTQAVMRSNLIARRLAINNTDLECMQLLLEKGKVTAGEIAAETFLSTGAITKMLDRLEKAGFISRQFEASDRRKVYVVANINKIIKEVFPLFQSLEHKMIEFLSKYSTEELQIILGFINKANEINLADLEKL